MYINIKREYATKTDKLLNQMLNHCVVFDWIIVFHEN